MRPDGFLKIEFRVPDFSSNEKAYVRNPSRTVFRTGFSDGTDFRNPSLAGEKSVSTPVRGENSGF